jgi:putative transposase
MNRIYRYRLYPNRIQSELINKTFGCVRFVYNKMLEDRKAAWEKFKDDPAALKAHRYPLPAAYKGSRPWLKEVDSLALANAYLHLEAAYRNFFKKDGCAFPKFKSKRRSKTSYTTNNQKGSVRIEEGRGLRLPKLGRIKMKLHRALPEGAKIKSATVSRTPAGRYYAAILVEVAETDTNRQTVKAVLSPEAAVTVTEGPVGWLYQDGGGRGEKLPVHLLKTQGRIKRETQRLKNKQAGGRNFVKQKKKIARLREKAANQKRDLLHQASRRIANAWEAVIVKEGGGEKRRRTGFGELKKLLAYKLESQGKRLLTVKGEEENAAAGARERPGRLPGVA